MQRTATILINTSLSSAVDFGCIGRLHAILMPAGWDAASITFQVSEDGSTFYNLVDDAGNDVTVTSPAASEAVGLREDLKRVFARFQHVKVRSGTPGAAVNQTAQRAVILLADTPIRS